MLKLTHAGGIVMKRDGDSLRYLIVRAKADETQWIFPKGHIEHGEVPRETAVREVREEAGIESRPLSKVGSSAFLHKSKEIHVVFFLLEYIKAVPGGEQRDVQWCTYGDAMRLLTFEDTKRLLESVHSVVEKLFPVI